jgi:AcrR family transcriptional regulator
MAHSNAADRPIREGPGRPRSVEASAAILDATFALLAEAGYAGLSVDAIASRAHVSKATLYRRWPSKAELVVAALAQAPPLASPPGGDLESELVALVEDYLAIADTTPLGETLPALVAESARDPELARVLAPLVRDRAAPLRSAFVRGVARGEISPDTDLDLAVRLILGPFVARVLDAPEATRREDVRRVIRITLAGLRHEAASEGERHV